MTFTYAIPFNMGYLDQEEQQYLQEVEAVKQWWTDSRWRFTKRPYTAEQIVQKRGNLKIEYPSNTLAKKAWKIMEEKFAVGPDLLPHSEAVEIDRVVEERSLVHLWLSRSHNGHADVQIPRDNLRFWLASFFHRLVD